MDLSRADQFKRGGANTAARAIVVDYTDSFSQPEDYGDSSWPSGWWIIPFAFFGALSWVGIIYATLLWVG
jgi:hypothetical protein